MSKVVILKKICQSLIHMVRRMGNSPPRQWTKYLSQVPKIQHRMPGCLLLLLVLGGCAAQADRTRELLELDLVDRNRAIASLEQDEQRQPAAWRAYSLGVLYGAVDDLNNMVRWFDLCAERTDLYDERIKRVRRQHWRKWAERADAAFDLGKWTAAVMACKKGLQAAPTEQTTRLRLVEARIMSWGPKLEEIRILASVNQTAVLDRWLESIADVADPKLRELRGEVRINLQSSLTGIDDHQTGDALAAFIIGELCRLDGDWVGLNQWYTAAEVMGDDQGLSVGKRGVIAHNRTNVTDRFLNQGLLSWSNDEAGPALARIDTARLLAPDRADLVRARNTVQQLSSVASASDVVETLGLGDLDVSLLTLWMTQLHHRQQQRQAALVADYLLDSPATTSGQRHQAWRVRSHWRIKRNDLTGAAEDLRNLLASGEKDVQAAIALSDVLLADSKFQEARAWLDQVSVWHSATGDVSTRQARVAFCQGRFDDMLKWAHHAVSLAPDDIEGQQLLTRARLLAGQGSEAEGRP